MSHILFFITYLNYGGSSLTSYNFNTFSGHLEDYYLAYFKGARAIVNQDPNFIH